MRWWWGSMSPSTTAAASRRCSNGACPVYTTRASITFSLRPGAQHWIATKPYALNPTADIYTRRPRRVACHPWLPAGAGRPRRSCQPVGRGVAWAGAVTVVPLTSASEWAAGVVLTQRNAARQALHNVGAGSVAVWLYAGGILMALTSTTHTLSPDGSFAAPAAPGWMRASLASHPSRDCGGK